MVEAVVEHGIDSASSDASQSGGQSDPKRKQWKRRGVTLASYLGAQSVVQVLSMLAGLALVRVLSPAELALFTIATGMQTPIGVLSDLGVSSALSARGGQIWQERRELGQLVRTGLDFRHGLWLVSAALVAPLLWWMLISNNSGALYAVILTACVVVGSYFQIGTGLLSVVPRLHSRLPALQKIDFQVAALRLLIVGAGLAMAREAGALVGVAATTASFGLGWMLTARQAWVDADLQQKSSVLDRAEIWKTVRHQVPNSLYFCVQSQLTIFLLTHFGSTRSIADIGALGRLAIIFTLLGTVLTNILMPRFARCQEAHQLRTMYGQIVGFYLALSAVVMALVILFPTSIMWLLGPQYAHLKIELAYVMFSTVAMAVSGVFYSLNAARSWLEGGWISIPITISAQLLLIPLLDLGTVKGVTLLSALPALAGAAPYIYRAQRHFQKMSLSLVSPE